MNEKQVSFEDFRKEQKKRERKEKLYNGVKKMYELDSEQ